MKNNFPALPRKLKIKSFIYFIKWKHVSNKFFDFFFFGFSNCIKFRDTFNIVVPDSYDRQSIPNQIITDMYAQIG